MESTVPGLVFGGEMSAEEYRAVFNDKTDWLSLTTEQKIEYRAKLRRIQLAGAVRLISIDADIEADISSASIAEKRKLRELDSTFKSQAKREKQKVNDLESAQKAAAAALGITLEQFQRDFVKKKSRVKCETHNLEFEMKKDGVTCPACEADEILKAMMEKKAKSVPVNSCTALSRLSDTPQNLFHCAFCGIFNARKLA
jgi:hypothetical protein